MKRRPEQKCGNCEFWDENPLYGPGMGGCHKGPPTPVMVGMTAVPPPVIARPDAPMQQAPVIVSYFPPIPAEGPQSWCGAWEPKTEGEA